MMEGLNGNESPGGRSLKLQVLICSYGKEGIRRVARALHPVIEGVEYLVSWQCEGDYEVPPELDRPDFRVIISRTKGLSVNRNLALSHSSAPLLLISDDDVDYTVEGLKTVIDSFAANPDIDIIAFRYASDSSLKWYPESPYVFGSLCKGHYITSFELAFRKDAVKGRVWFNENFGIGAPFGFGEEEIFVKECIEKGLKGKYLPEIIAKHDGLTTCDRNLMAASRPLTKGAVCLRLYPADWPLRAVANAVREIESWRKGLVPSPFSFLVNWFKGAYKAKRLRVFPTPDYSQKYLCNGRSV